jgi:hypothetical protein
MRVWEVLAATGVGSLLAMAYAVRGMCPAVHGCLNALRHCGRDS